MDLAKAAESVGSRKRAGMQEALCTYSISPGPSLHGGQQVLCYTEIPGGEIQPLFWRTLFFSGGDGRKKTEARDGMM